MEARRHCTRPRKIKLSETRGHLYHSISCEGCGRAKYITGLSSHFPARYQSARLDELKVRLRCEACGHKGASIMATSAPDCGACLFRMRTFR